MGEAKVGGQFAQRRHAALDSARDCDQSDRAEHRHPVGRRDSGEAVARVWQQPRPRVAGERRPYERSREQKPRKREEQIQAETQLGEGVVEHALATPGVVGVCEQPDVERQHGQRGQPAKPVERGVAGWRRRGGARWWCRRGAGLRRGRVAWSRRVVVARFGGQQDVTVRLKHSTETNRNPRPRNRA